MSIVDEMKWCHESTRFGSIHGIYFGPSCPDCKRGKREMEKCVSLFLEPIYRPPPTLVDLGGPEGPGRGYAYRQAREIMGPASNEIQRDMLGQIQWIGQRP